MRPDPFTRLKARAGYAVARQLFHWRWCMRQPRVWRWMQGQYARMAALGDRDAQSFQGHLLLFRGKGMGVRQEAMRLLHAAAEQGEAKAAYQLGRCHYDGDPMQPADVAEAAHWWQQAADAGHPLAASRLARLYRDGAPGLPVDQALADRYEERARTLGL